MGDLKEIGLVLQGGGALGAYEYGAIQALLENGYVPRVVSGVSIGAINAAVLAGARGELPRAEADGPGGAEEAEAHRQSYLGALCRNMRASLDGMWDRLAMPNNPFLPAGQQAMLSTMGHPAFWALRRDWAALLTWTSVYDVQPMERTLREVVDFGRINGRDPPVRMAVTATCIETGGNTRFANYDPEDAAAEVARALDAERTGAGAAADRHPASPLGTIRARTRIGPDHILASGALPPGFPGVWIEGRTYWDGGLFDNTPIRPLIEMLTAEQAEHLPIVVVNLFPHLSPVPTDLMGVFSRMTAIQYQSRFADGAGGYGGLIRYGEALARLLRVSVRVLESVADDPALEEEVLALQADPQFRRLLLYRAFRNVIIIPALTDFAQIGPMDFSAHGIGRRRAAGHEAVTTRLAENGGRLDAREAAIYGPSR